MKKIPFLFLLILSISSHMAFAQQVWINELMSSNASSITDEDGDNSDWIELYNGGDEAVNLMGYGLSDDLDKPLKWVLPEVMLHPGEFLIVWASSKDRKQDKAALHTNFNISADGEALTLSSPDGTVIDETPSVSIPTDFSYGRQSEESKLFHFFSIPSPGAPNNESGFEAPLDPPVFSLDGGFYSAPFDLNLTASDPDAVIIYTLDGSMPDPENLDGSTYYYKNQYTENNGNTSGPLIPRTFESLTYSGPIAIEDRSTKEDKLTNISSTYHNNPYYFPSNPVYKGTTVRAQTIKPGTPPSETVTNTYFIHNDTHNRYSLPVVALSVQEDLLFDYDKGLYVAGKYFEDWRIANPFAPADGGSNANYHQSGRAWEYPAHIELFAGEEGQVFSQSLGVRTHGNWSTSHPMKSLRLYGRNEYGESRLEYPFFPDRKHDAYKRLILRNSGNDWGYTMFRDAAIQSVVKHMDFETQAYQPTVLFINSEYWGIHNLRERFDKHYLERMFGIDPDNIDLLEANGIVSEGDNQHYNETLAYISSNGLNQDQYYDYIKTRIDVNSFMDYQIAQIYIANEDWPGNNNKYWRAKTEFDPTAPKGQDGRWRWLMYDTDFGFGLYNGNAYTINSLEFATAPNAPDWPNPPWSTFLLRKFLENESFRNEFINRFSDQLNTALKPEVVKKKINNIKEAIAPEIEEHIHRWKSPGSMNTWTNHVNNMLNFAEKRPAAQRQHLKDFFGLGNVYTLNVDVSDPQHGYVKINSLALREGTAGLEENIYPWAGEYFGGVPIALEAIPTQGYEFVRWKGLDNNKSNEISITPSSNLSLEAVFRMQYTEPQVLHYWNFNKPDNLNEPSHTLLSGSLEFNMHSGKTEFTDDDKQGFSGENAQFEDEAGSHLRINEPLNAELIFSLPTTGFSDIVFTYETRRSGKGAGVQIIAYTLDGTTFIEKERISVEDGDPSIYTVDFSAIAEAGDNENFGIRITFEEGEGSDGGNNRFDNITLKGMLIDIPTSINDRINSDLVVKSYPNPFSNETTISITSSKSSSIGIALYTITGKEVKRIAERELPAGHHEIAVPANDLAPGIYILVCQSGDEHMQYKLIKY